MVKQQNGYCFLTDEDIANGKTNYTDGRTVIYAIAQGKAAGTKHNEMSGWAHNFAIPLELWLHDNLTDVIREPIKEIESLYEGKLFTYNGDGKTVEEINDMISDVRGDTLRIDMSITLNPTSDQYKGGINVRYNKNETAEGTEKTQIVFSNEGVYIDRLKSSLIPDVEKTGSYTWANTDKSFDVTILLDRSMLEVYVNGVISFTTRIYPKYGDSDYLSFFDSNANLTVNKMVVYNMKSAYTAEMTPPYYGNTGNLGE